MDRADWRTGRLGGQADRGGQAGLGGEGRTGWTRRWADGADNWADGAVSIILDTADWGRQGRLANGAIGGTGGRERAGCTRGRRADRADWAVGERGGGRRMGRTGQREVYGMGLGGRIGRTGKPRAGVLANWADRLG